MDHAEQEVTNVEFVWITECERTLDDVVEKLADAGLVLEPWQRMVVARWLEMFSDNSPVPLGYRLTMLKGMLAASRETVFDG